MSVTKKFKPYKDTDRQRTEQFTKKTKASIKQHAHPKLPGGCVFVPKGDAYITRKCTTLTRDGGQEVRIVYGPNAKRIGLQVPKHVWKRVLAEAAQTAAKRREAVRRKDARDTAKAKAVLRKHYPNVPSSDLEQVVAHAFMKGSGRVGRKGGQSVERRASLAVGAHVRHKYTAYDDMLNRGAMSRRQARDRVWETVRDIKLAWSGKASKAPGKTSSEV